MGFQLLLTGQQQQQQQQCRPKQDSYKQKALHTGNSKGRYQQGRHQQGRHLTVRLTSTDHACEVLQRQEQAYQ